jgi:hypothetical protein
MKDVIVFSHLMKTAGSSLLRSLAQYYEPKVLYINKGSLIEDTKYSIDYLERDFDKKKGITKVLFGHCIRPHINFNVSGYNFRWSTFLREPNKRYLSHYYHSYHFTSNNFKNRRYNGMSELNIEEWEKIDQNSNYQCKFISGEANAQKAIDIIENKFEWVGITEEFESGINSFKTYFDIEDLDYKNIITNQSLANKEDKELIKAKYAGFIMDMNKEDKILYDYVKKNIWPRFKSIEPKREMSLKSNSLIKQYNTFAFHIDNQLNFNKTKLSRKNLMRFYKRWF